MKILVTGASGFIGQACSAVFQKKNIPFVTPHKDFYGELSRYDLLCHKDILACIQEKRPTHILHLAWHTGAQYANDIRNTAWLEAGKELIRVFSTYGGKRFMGVGTCFEYALHGMPCKEGSSLLSKQVPHTIYGQAKRDLSNFLESFAKEKELSWAWVRPFYVFGASENAARLLPSAAKLFAREENFSTPALQRCMDYIAVEDVAEIMINILLSTHCGKVNIGRGRGVFVKDILALLAAHFSDFVHAAPQFPLDETPPIVADTTRLSQWCPHFSFKSIEDSLHEYYEVYKNG